MRRAAVDDAVDGVAELLGDLGGVAQPAAGRRGWPT